MNVGDYVRYEYEDCIYIGKIKFISEVMGFDETLQFEIDNCIEEILKQDIIKSSPNIIDLIEEDDFINQARVSEIIKKTKDSIRFMVDSDYEFSTELKEEEIETILTKEQFSQMEYRIGE